ncbi:MAG: acyl-CoA synthetase [Gammaproteobacteria bacterium]|nr:acyl-CoA synthetase [Gammaproteobacteria bacterium]
MALHFANAWESVAQEQPQKTALICGDNEVTWADYDRRAACLADLLAKHGLGHNSKVGIYAHNSNEYVEAQYATFKIGGCPVNVNYRYKADELIYLLENSDAEALFFQGCYAARIWEIRSRLPNVKLFVQIDDGTESLLDEAIEYERGIREAAPRPPEAHSPDDVYMLYTGGTTGMPKGVMYSHGQFIGVMLSSLKLLDLPNPADTSELAQVVRTLNESELAPIALPACPLMHGTGMWLGTMVPLLQGGTVVTISKLGLDPHLIWSEIERNKVSNVVIVGDAFARPMLEALNDAKSAGRGYDITSLQQITSSGVMWSREVKQGLLEHHDMTLLDAMGSTEGGMGSSVATRDAPADTAKFKLQAGVKVFDDHDEEIEPGSGDVGKLATSGLVPIGYYKDEEKSAATFRTVNGVRYSFPGDFATIEADGSITLLGRGSNCINTAGEKVYPEEVEEALKKHPAVNDCLVVGVADERFGQRIVALASLREGELIEETALIDFSREHLAGYKLPKQLLLLDEVRRAPNGKADYKWAKQTAERQLNIAKS